MARIAVIGAGIAGLSAAHDLTSFGHEVAVLESSDIPGGRMADRIVNGICTHTGASGLFSFNRELLSLVNEVGMGDDLMTVEDDAFGTLVDNGKMTYGLRMTFNPWYMLGHPAFGLRTKLRLARMLPDILRARRTDPCLMQTAIHLDDESVTDYITRKVLFRSSSKTMSSPISAPPVTGSRNGYLVACSCPFWGTWLERNKCSFAAVLASLHAGWRNALTSG